MHPSIERLALAGFALHWLHPKSKRPIGDDWSEKPVATLAELKRTYRDGNNVGFRPGEWSKVAGYYLHVIDLDIQDAEDAEEALETLNDIFPELDIATCPTVISGSGGASRHFYFLCVKAFRKKVVAKSTRKIGLKYAWQIELYGTGANLVLPPSIHPDTGNPYRWIRPFDFDAMEFLGPTVIPASAIERMIDEADPVTNFTPVQPVGFTPADVRELLIEIPNKDRDYDDWLNIMASVQHECSGLSKEERLEFYEVFREWSARSKKHDDKVARSKFFSFRNSDKRPNRTIRSIQSEVREIQAERQFDSLEDDFDDVEVEQVDMFDDLLGSGETPKKLSKSQLKLKKEEVEFELGREVPPKVARLNKLHAVARVSSKTVVLDFHDDGHVTYGNVGDLHAYYENDRVPKEDTTEPVTKQWMRSKSRRSYPKGIVFAPNKDVPGAYNHWQGFSIEPDETKSCELFLSHLFKIFCNGDEGHYRYVLGWLAHMIQRPEEKPGVAVIARGKKRIGKDTVFEYVGSLFTNHYITVGNQDQMTGKFNAHQERCLLLHMQEGFWAGDKKAEGQLKYLITSNNVMIEPKGMNAFPITSVLRIFISSNERWVIPATQDEGRFFVVNVSDKRRNDHKYFEAIRQERDNGGREALLAYLMTYDISDFQVRAVPDTEALAEQKIEGLKNVERWWLGILQHGSIDGTGANHQNDISNNQWGAEGIRVEKNDFRDGYSRWMRSRRYDGEEVTEMEFSKRMKAMVPQLEEARPRAASGRLRVFCLPELELCRRGFEQMMGSEIIWPESNIKIIDMDEEDDL